MSPDSTPWKNSYHFTSFTNDVDIDIATDTTVEVELPALFNNLLHLQLISPFPIFSKF
jgi:hypothetical protein